MIAARRRRTKIKHILQNYHSEVPRHPFQLHTDLQPMQSFKNSHRLDEPIQCIQARMNLPKVKFYETCTNHWIWSPGSSCWILEVSVIHQITRLTLQLTQMICYSGKMQLVLEHESHWKLLHLLKKIPLKDVSNVEEVLTSIWFKNYSDENIWLAKSFIMWR